MVVTHMEPSIKELRIKIIIAFILSIASLQLLTVGSLFRSYLNISFNFTDFVNTTVTMMLYGVPISMSIVSLVFIKQGKEINNNPYRILKGFGYGFSIASLIIYGVIFTFSFLVALFSGNIFF